MRQFGLGLFQGSDVADHEFRIGALFDSHPALDQYRYAEAQLVREPPVVVREAKDVHRAIHVLELALRVEVALLRLGDADIPQYATDQDFVPAGGRLEAGNFAGGERAEVQ